MKFKDVAISDASTEAKVAALAVLLDKELLKLAETVLNVQTIEGAKGEQGLQGPKGEQGDRGFDGTNGKDGSDGKDGKDGEAGKQGVGVQDAKIDFDGSLVITLTDGTEINAGEVVPLDTAEKIRVIGNGGGTSQSVLDAIAAIQATIATYGTMATQNANNVAITGGSINGTTVGSTTAAAGTFTTLTATGQVNFNSSSGQTGFLARLNTNGQTSGYTEFAVTDGTRFSEVGLALTSVTSYGNANEAYFRGSGSTVGTVISSASATTPRIRFITGTSANSSEQLRVTDTASAVNYVQVTGAATGNAPTISAQGSDTNAGLTLNSKGAGTLLFQTNGTTRASINSGATFSAGILASGVPAFVAAATASQVNYLQANGSATGGGLQFQAVGSDTNISQVFQSKGTGAIDLAAGSRGVNISNGGTVTAITVTAAGVYTSFPTGTISAPTTAGGVQATFSFSAQITNTPTITSGGTGYTVNDVLTFVGGTFTAAGSLTVTSVSGGVITGVSVATYGAYTVLPSNPISVTGGTGSGATFTSTWGVRNAFPAPTITNAGSGYVEQPTVTFSGGGGSGAAAYATVGSTPIVKSVAGAMNFQTAGGTQFAVVDNATPTSYPYISGGNGAGGIGVLGATNSGLFISARGTSAVTLQTNNFSQTQLNVAHTASAVNYVQVTGNTTTLFPNISAQGSDSNIGLTFASKGSQSLRFNTNSTDQQFRITHTGSAVNYVQVTGNIAGSSPRVLAEGSDTNIDLTLTPKGTGNVRFGTYTASMALTVQGYIEIKDSGGTVRKLAVIA